MFRVGDKVRCIHNPPSTPEGSMEFVIAGFKQGDGVFTDVDTLYAGGPSLHSAARILWPIEKLTLIEGEGSRGN
jgi:hypothetical protein